MDKLLNFANKHTESAPVCELDEALFQQFMVKNPIWEFNSITKDEYLHMNKEQIERLISNYYTSMEKGEHYIILFVCLFKELSFYFSKLFLSKISE